MGDIIWNLILMAAGFALLIKGSDFVVDGACGIATKLKIPQVIIGLTIVAFGTSAPEAAVSFNSALEGSADITVGNILGSNILNIFIILGASAIITPLTVNKNIVKADIPVMIGATLLLFALGIDGSVSFSDALILLVGLVGYMTYLFMIARKNTDEDKIGKIKIMPMWRAVLLTVIGIAGIIFGSELSVDGATKLAMIFGISERVIGLTVVALGTSLPELFTSISAAKKHNADIAIGNVVGSNILNVLFIVGVSGVIAPVSFVATFMLDMAVVIIASFLIYVMCVFNDKLSKISGIVMLGSYVVYFLFLLLE